MNKIEIIAEAGVNHDGSIYKAYKLCKIAKNSGATYVKFQIFDVNEQISKFAKTANYQKKNTQKKNMIDMAKKYNLSLSDHLKIKNYCKKIKIKYLASCFDKNSAKFYKKFLNKKEIKIGSGEITNFPLLKYIANEFQTVILSTGMSNLNEIKKAVKILTKKNNKLYVLHCNSMYPIKLENVNLNTIRYLKEELNLKIGFSDHTLEIETGKLAVALGANILEKHITYSNNSFGPDHKMSLNPNNFKLYVNEVHKITKILGLKQKILSKKELEMKKFARRGIVAKKNLQVGALVNFDNFTFKRPCIGIPCENFMKYKGKKIKKKIRFDQNLTISHFK